eukprot:1147632-Pelagomonas_calceolata.AAC.5
MIHCNLLPLSTSTPRADLTAAAAVLQLVCEALSTISVALHCVKATWLLTAAAQDVLPHNCAQALHLQHA